MGEKRLVVGLMSGTSADGVDAALIETDGEAHVRLIATHERPYTPEERRAIRDAAGRALALSSPPSLPLEDEAIVAAERMMTLAHAEAVAALAGSAGATLIGFHGATIAHRPDKGWTWQMGDAALLARLTGRSVVHDFRSADVAAGGEGAPLAPGFHRAMVAGMDWPVAVLNIGGVANISWFGRNGWGAFDTGPGNALIDDWVMAHGAGTRDEGGALAAAGEVRMDVLSAMLDLPWFDLKGPKSLDRDDFSIQPARGLALADGAATLTAFTAEAVAIALRQLPERIGRLLVTGGGRHNRTLMRMLAERTGVPVAPVEAYGFDGDSLEAQAFAWLAARVVEGLPTSWPETTGVPAPLCGGRVAEPD
ncbi:anhydro-N-acetylmuramic acid kinase [Thermaurantiacus sp.]